MYHLKKRCFQVSKVAVHSSFIYYLFVQFVLLVWSDLMRLAAARSLKSNNDERCITHSILAPPPRDWLWTAPGPPQHPGCAFDRAPPTRSPGPQRLLLRLRRRCRLGGSATCWFIRSTYHHYYCYYYRYYEGLTLVCTRCTWSVIGRER